tara:strand:+ start:874 stop:1056 length:183 start_codon:yes stop_codon:yes gene_type:complete
LREIITALMRQHRWATPVEQVCPKDMQPAQKLANGYQTSLCQTQAVRKWTTTTTERVENL